MLSREAGLKMQNRLLNTKVSREAEVRGSEQLSLVAHAISSGNAENKIERLPDMAIITVIKGASGCAERGFGEIPS